LQPSHSEMMLRGLGVRVRNLSAYLNVSGLPFSFSEVDISRSLGELLPQQAKLIHSPDQVALTFREDGRLTGSAIIRFDTAEEASTAGSVLNGTVLPQGDRFIKTRVVEETPDIQSLFEDRAIVLKIMNLPYSANSRAIKDFFAPLELDAVYVARTSEGLHSGFAYIFLKDLNDLQQAMSKNQMSFGDRNIKLVRCSLAPVKEKLEADLQEEQSFCVFARGFPTGVTEEQVMEFFAGANLHPLKITFTDDRNWNAVVAFKTVEEAELAHERLHRQHLGFRYIDILPR